VDDWKEWGVLSSLEIIDPPEFLLPSEEGNEELNEPTEVVQKHYNDVVGQLRDSGYEHLVTLKNRLESHLSKAEDRVRRCRGRVQKAKLQHKAYRQQLQKIAVEEAGNPAEVEAKFSSLLSTPIGKQWFTDGEIEADPGENWDVSRTDSFDFDTPLSNLKIRYEVTDEALDQFEIPQEEFDSESFQSWPVRSFSGNATWESVFESLKNHINFTLRNEKRAAKTLQFLRFRLSIVETVLYRFEAFSSVEEMTEEGTLQIEEENAPGRKSTLKDPDTHPVIILKALLEWTGDDSNRTKPFRSESQPSLCGHVSKRLKEPAGHLVSQDTIKSRLQSLMRELGVELPRGHTNKRSYFEAREEITEAMKEHGLV
jgi:hypothetical protein